MNINIFTSTYSNLYVSSLTNSNQESSRQRDVKEKDLRQSQRAIKESQEQVQVLSEENTSMKFKVFSRHMIMLEKTTQKTNEDVDRRQARSKDIYPRSQSMKEQRIKTILQRHAKFKSKKTEDLTTWSIIRMTTP